MGESLRTHTVTGERSEGWWRLPLPLLSYRDVHSVGVGREVPVEGPIPFVTRELRVYGWQFFVGRVPSVSYLEMVYVWTESGVTCVTSLESYPDLTLIIDIWTRRETGVGLSTPPWVLPLVDPRPSPVSVGVGDTLCDESDPLGRSKSTLLFPLF